MTSEADRVRLFARRADGRARTRRPRPARVVRVFRVKQPAFFGDRARCRGRSRTDATRRHFSPRRSATRLLRRGGQRHESAADFRDRAARRRARSLCDDHHRREEPLPLPVQGVDAPGTVRLPARMTRRARTFWSCGARRPRRSQRVRRSRTGTTRRSRTATRRTRCSGGADRFHAQGEGLPRGPAGPPASTCSSTTSRRAASAPGPAGCCVTATRRCRR